MSRDKFNILAEFLLIILIISYVFKVGNTVLCLVKPYLVLLVLPFEFSRCFLHLNFRHSSHELRYVFKV